MEHARYSMGLAMAGAVMKSLFTGKLEWLSVTVYICTGWLVLLAIKPILAALSPEGFMFLLAGGLAYTIGTFFYVNSRIPYGHSIWHLWVVAGSILHFFSVLTLNYGWPEA
jgi:hemolysin III